MQQCFIGILCTRALTDDVTKMHNANIFWQTQIDVQENNKNPPK
jgi:hypothetical protein